jgi:hypothetical protein
MTTASFFYDDITAQMGVGDSWLFHRLWNSTTSDALIHLRHGVCSRKSINALSVARNGVSGDGGGDDTASPFYSTLFLLARASLLHLLVMRPGR